MLKVIRTYFYAGIIVLLPIFFTIYIINWLINIVIGLTLDSFMVAIIHKVIRILGLGQNNKIVLVIYIIYLLMILIFIILIGLITKNIVGKKLKKKMDELICKLPIIKQVYSTMLQIVSLVSSNKNSGYKKVVSVEYPKKGIYSIGFLTAEKNEAITKCYGRDVYNVFIPTSPNPTSGMFICVPVEDVHELNMTVEDGIKLIVSGGVIAPGLKYDLDENDEK